MAEIKKRENYSNGYTWTINRKWIGALLLDRCNFTTDEELQTIKSITFKDVQEFTSKWLVHTRFEWFAYGNVSEEKMMGMAMDGEKVFNSARKNC